MGKPNCYGDDDMYSGTSRICNNCGWRADCKAQITKEGHRSGWSPQTNTHNKKEKHTNGSIGPIMPTGSGNLGIGPSVYNHGDSLAPQFMRYLGYSVAESTLEEARVLVQSMRNNYTQQQIRAVQPLLEITDPTKKDK